MNNFLSFYQHIPEHINPVAFRVGFFSVSWYAVMYLVAFVVVCWLANYRISRNEMSNVNCRMSNGVQNLKFYQNTLIDFFLYSITGLLIGARMGEVFFYNFSYYFHNPLVIISPFNSAGEYIGIYGMSYHGGLVGVILASWFWSKKNGINLINWANFFIPSVPLGYFFGRLGNFINGELYGRVTDKWWGMYFPLDQSGNLRHPSQIYEAFLEGMFLFLLLWPLRNKKIMRENGLAVYLIGYGAARIIIEFFRQPDGWVGIFTIGQFLSIFMIIGGIWLFQIKGKFAILFKRKGETKIN